MMESQFRRLDALSLPKRTARLHPPSQIKRLARSIECFGFVAPIISSSGEIIAGEARIEAAQSLEISTIPVAPAQNSETQRKYSVSCTTAIPMWT
jgi:ParB-like chromosome segregation protein Spo0J